MIKHLLKGPLKRHFRFVIDRLTIKHRAKKHRSLMQSGIWRINRNYASKTGSKSGSFRNYSQIAANRNSSNSKGLKRVLATALGLNHMFIARGKKEGCASVVYLSRSNELKIFDYQKGQVLTETTNEAWNIYKNKINQPIFDFFQRPNSTLVKNSTGLFRQEELVQSPALGVLRRDDQIRAVKRVLDTYRKYIEQQKEPPRPDIVLHCFHEVAHLLPHNIRNVYLQRQMEVEDLARRYSFVKIHGDFNVANILMDEEIWLLDNDNVGISAPCMFDLYNLGLNELFENRSAHILKSIDSGELSEALQPVLHVAVRRPEPSDLRVALFINYFMRESALIARQILGGVRANRAIKRWYLFNEGFSWWMDPSLKLTKMDSWT